MKRKAGAFAGVLWAMAANAGVTWYAVDPMGEKPYMPDQPPTGGREGGVVRIIAAQGEYEPGSFVLCADEDLGKVKLEVGDLRQVKEKGQGAVFPAKRLDLKTVKVWYQNGNAWLSYFADPKLRLCPELLLNDEDLVKVDTAKGWNYARLKEKDGSVSYRWLNPPEQIDTRCDDAWNVRLHDSFFSMKENFSDAPEHCGATLRKGEYKQFFLTADVTGNVAPGLYRGEVKVKGKDQEWRVPISLRVLDFTLPSPKCYFDVEKDYCTWFCEYNGMKHILDVNGNDRALAEKQIVAILKDFVRHGETIPNYDAHETEPQYGLAAGMCFTNHLLAGAMTLGEKAEMRFDARRLREKTDKLFGPAPKYLCWGDEYRLTLLRGIRPMIRIYQEEGFMLTINSQIGYAAAGYLSDLWWPPFSPDHESSTALFKFNQLGGEGYTGWYAKMHTGSENPAFNRRQYGIGPYRAGLSGNYNYAHFIQGWNDIGQELYKPMILVYGCGSGCIDTLQWEGFREGLDDIRYATKLKQLALPMVKSDDIDRRYAAKKALQVLADADGDDMDLTTLRLEMIRHINRLLALDRDGVRPSHVRHETKKEVAK